MQVDDFGHNTGHPYRTLEAQLYSFASFRESPWPPPSSLSDSAHVPAGRCLHRDWAHPSHRNWARPSHICTGTGLSAVVLANVAAGGRLREIRRLPAVGHARRGPLSSAHERGQTPRLFVRANSPASARAVGIARLCRRVPSAPAAWSPAVVQRPLGPPAAAMAERRVRVCTVCPAACTVPRRFGHVCVRSCARHARARDSLRGLAGPAMARPLRRSRSGTTSTSCSSPCTTPPQRSVGRLLSANKPAAAYIVRHAAAQAAGRRSATAAVGCERFGTTACCCPFRAMHVPASAPARSCLFGMATCNRTAYRASSALMASINAGVKSPASFIRWHWRPSQPSSCPCDPMPKRPHADRWRPNSVGSVLVGGG